MKTKTIMGFAAAFGFMAIAFGAMGAHALKAHLDAEGLKAFETGVRYQAWHAIALLAISLSGASIKYQNAIAWTWILGTFLFSGSIYLLSTSEISGLQVSFLGPTTPIGGLLFMSGWLLLLLSAYKHGSKNG